MWPFVTFLLLYMSRGFWAIEQLEYIKAGLYIIWCGVSRLGDSGVHTLGDTAAFVNAAVQLLLTRRCKIRMDGVGIVFELYSPSLMDWTFIHLLLNRLDITSLS